MDLSLNLGFPIHALRVYRQFTWPLWELVTSSLRTKWKHTTWHRIKPSVLFLLLLFLHCYFCCDSCTEYFPRKVSWALQLMLFQILRHVTLTFCNQNSENWNWNHWSFVYSLCRKETDERKQANSFLVKRGLVGLFLGSGNTQRNVLDPGPCGRPWGSSHN